MRSFALVPCLVVCAAGAALAQSPGHPPHPITAPVRPAGTYHVATSTWSRHATQSLAPLDVLYDNTCSAGYFGTLSGDTYVDEGRLPSPTSPTTVTSVTGCATSYRVDGFEISYCTDQSSVAMTVRFWDAYAACTDPSPIHPTGAFALSGLPGAVGGAVNCWIVDVDTSTLADGSAFVMRADGDGSFGGPTDTFGVAFSSTTGGMTGPVIAGDPNTCAFGAGTVWSTSTTSGTGLGTQNRFFIFGGPTAPGCYFFGPPPNPYASFFLQISGHACDSTGPGIAWNDVCPGDSAAGHTACPCSNGTRPEEAVGCANSTGLGGRVRVDGKPSLSADSLVLWGSQMPSNATVYWFQGSLVAHGGAGAVFGDGLRCADGSVKRIGPKVASSGASSTPGAGDPPLSVTGAVTAPGTRIYQALYRDVATFCTSANFNLSNAMSVTWGP